MCQHVLPLTDFGAPTTSFLPFIGLSVKPFENICWWIDQTYSEHAIVIGVKINI